MEKFPGNNTLSKKKIKKIMEKVSDKRLENREGDYFVLHRGGKKTFIPKQETIRVRDKDGFSYVATGDYILSLLKEGN